MLSLSKWLDRRRFLKAFRGYPSFDYPVKRNIIRMSPAEQIANYEYFIKTKDDRRNIFLHSLGKFDIKVDFSRSSTLFLSDWFVKYGGFFVTGDTTDSSFVFYDYSKPPSDKERAQIAEFMTKSQRNLVAHFDTDYDGERVEWTGEYLYYSLIMDFSALLGDIIIHYRDDISWGIKTGRGFKAFNETNDDIGEACLCLDGKHDPFSMFGLVHIISSCLWREYRNGPYHRSDMDIHHIMDRFIGNWA